MNPENQPNNNTNPLDGINQIPVQMPVNNQAEPVISIQPVTEIPSTVTPPEAIVQPPLESQKKKGHNGLFLIILFIFLTAFIIFLPQINEYMSNKKMADEQKKLQDQLKKEEDLQNKPTTTPSITPDNGTLKTMKCTSAKSSTNDMSLQLTSELSYLNNKIKKVKLSTIEIFKEENEAYNEVVKSCSTETVQYNNKPGYHAECVINGTMITIETTFDLKEFVPIVDETNGVTISSTIVYDTDIKEVMDSFVKQDYICK